MANEATQQNVLSNVDKAIIETEAIITKKMTDYFKDAAMKPMVILPPDTMSKEDMDRLRDNGVCVVEAKEPASVKFVDPIPSISSRTEIENAAIQLSRKIMRPGFWTNGVNSGAHQAVVRTFVDVLIKGTPLDSGPTKQERELQIFNEEKETELRRLAREEAKEERAAAKAAAKKAAPPETKK